ncbi:hypothetical protein ASE49_05785 [Novosphingobium sp. Leaf2]|nr:hypothetical protein ASE49_05785 [Novosphingobium sp. Leaf2]
MALGAGVAVVTGFVALRGNRALAPGGVIPRTRRQIAAAAAARGMRVPVACAQGVAANLALLAEHAERLRTDAPPGPS